MVTYAHESVQIDGKCFIDMTVGCGNRRERIRMYTTVRTYSYWEG
jgi:hypothetical protein